jgi:hypothetical protein
MEAKFGMLFVLNEQDRTAENNTRSTRFPITEAAMPQQAVDTRVNFAVHSIE